MLQRALSPAARGPPCSGDARARRAARGAPPPAIAMPQVAANMEYQEYKWAYSIMDSSKWVSVTL